MRIKEKTIAIIGIVIVTAVIILVGTAIVSQIFKGLF